ncbi:MAG: alanine racemase [Lachnospiraceae bacterium]|jgi:alanine racemase|nr:alanine racemase [Lachnospiraceae bacterium]MCI1726664.1 alanine racemase [Lachnospiraceae bacterium]
MKKYSRIRAEIDLDAAEFNFRSMKANLAPDTKITAVIKADGYGHGAREIGRMIEPWDFIWGYATATPEEAEELRNAGLKKPVLLLGKAFPESYEDIIRQDIRACIFEYEPAKELSETAGRMGKKAIVHIAVDTGMSRIGFSLSDDSVETVRKISELPNLEIEGIFTHFARADEADLSPAYVQLGRFLDFVGRVEKCGVKIPIHHCSNSAGIIRVKEANLSMVRAGITIYGLWPSSEVEKHIVPLKPVMSLISHIAYVKTLEAGREISYGGTYRTEKETRVATIPVGYADGYPRQLSNRGWVLIHGKKAPILGRVCMDQFMVDVTDIPEAQEYDETVLLGSQGGETITAEDIGDLSGRFNYELTCNISKRVPRVFIRNGRRTDEVDYFG